MGFYVAPIAPSASSTLFHTHTVAHQPNLPCHATSSGVSVRFDGGLLPS